ncbi:hypothetical protein [Rossellomorea marisflavi]|uniref:hypothetical protein n=1 Tax=Rossellomorea marisflavi TaxID=189381 RepID=UPI00064FED0D|nr:hypothetical protein [Rossellomorea marisflavi]KML03109.1 hypothetical protein VL06_15800 [Rossellomorea marisflavi]KML31577.1 hypothetical protein VL12_17785 [Rossellomorea marisflavi]USK93153.1 hypothetical protein LIT29_05220 [Rossellomorea marisflavi]
MDFLSWNDWLTPTNPMASIFFGLIFTIIVGVTVWWDTRKMRSAFVAALTGILVTVVGVAILNAIGFYA